MGAAPEHVVQTLEHVVQTLEHVVQTLEHVVQTLEHVVQTPEHVVQTPEHVVQAPEHVVQTPEHVVQAPEHVVQTPEHVVQTPEQLVQTLEHVVQTPEHVVQTLEHVVQTPEHVVQTPERAGWALQHVAKTPRPVEKTAELVVKMPEHAPKMPEHVARASEQRAAIVYARAMVLALPRRGSRVQSVVLASGARFCAWAALFSVLGACTEVQEQDGEGKSDASPSGCTQTMPSEPDDGTSDDVTADDASVDDTSSTGDVTGDEEVDDTGASSNPNDGPDGASGDPTGETTDEPTDVAEAGAVTTDDSTSNPIDAGEPTDASQPQGNSGDADTDASVPGCASFCGTITELESEGNEHVEIGTDVDYGHNPPASGPHYPIWAQYGAYDEVVPRRYWVHNLEHGTVVLLYGPSATPEQQAELRAVYDALPDDAACGHKRAVLTEDPDLDDAIAVVAWTWVLEASCVDSSAILAFVEAHRGHGTEAVCGDGSFTP